MEYIVKTKHGACNLLRELPTGSQMVTKLLGQDIPPDYLWFNPYSGLIYKKNTQVKDCQNDLPYMTIRTDTCTIKPLGKRYKIEYLYKKLNGIFK